MPFLTAALYKFVELPDYAALQAPLLALCEAHGIKGTLLLAAEGINGTVAGHASDVHAVLAYLRADPRLAALEHKESWADAMPFYRMKVRLKKEIVTLGVPDVHPALMAGQYVKPSQWKPLLPRPPRSQCRPSGADLLARQSQVPYRRGDHDHHWRFLYSVVDGHRGADGPYRKTHFDLDHVASGSQCIRHLDIRVAAVAVGCGGIQCGTRAGHYRADA